LVDLVGPMPYTAWQSILDATYPAGLMNYWKASYIDEISDDAIDAIVSHFPDCPSPISGFHLQYLKGAVGRVPQDATAYGHRDANYVINILSIWDGPDEDNRNFKWAQEFYSDLKPFMSGAYINFMGIEGEDRIKAAYGEQNFQRLVTLKRKFDPTNVFKLNQNIKP
jgi:hypothetical protein